MKEWPFKKSGGGTRQPTPWWRRKLWWLIACAAISIAPLLLEMFYLLITKLPFSLIVSMPGIPAIAVIWCAMTIIAITRLEEYKRVPFQLNIWMSVIAGLAALDLAGYVVLLAGRSALLLYLFLIIVFVPVAATVAACFFAQRFMAQLETQRVGEHE